MSILQDIHKSAFLPPSKVKSIVYKQNDHRGKLPAHVSYWCARRRYTSLKLFKHFTGVHAMQTNRKHISMTSIFFQHYSSQTCNVNKNVSFSCDIFNSDTQSLSSSKNLIENLRSQQSTRITSSSFKHNFTNLTKNIASHITSLSLTRIAFVDNQCQVMFTLSHSHGVKIKKKSGWHSLLA